MLIALGVLSILLGVVTLFQYRHEAARGAEVHRTLSKSFPWLYRLFRPATSERTWKVIALLGGGVLIAVGVIFISLQLS